MKRLILPVIGALLLGGCQAERVTDVGTDAREAIAFATTAKRPASVQTSDRVQAVALDSPDAKEITIYNLRSEAVPATAIWINGTYVRQTGTMGPRGHVTAKYGAFLEAGNPANDFARTMRPVMKVELQTAEGIYPVLGPGLR